jgi:hypothetical protein
VSKPDPGASSRFESGRVWTDGCADNNLKPLEVYEANVLVYAHGTDAIGCGAAAGGADPPDLVAVRVFGYGAGSESVVYGLSSLKH